MLPHELALAKTEQRHAHTDVATLFVPRQAALELLSLCAQYNAQILSVHSLAKVYARFSVEVVSPNCDGSELLAEWADAMKLLEEDCAS